MLQGFLTAQFACWLRWSGGDALPPFHRTHMIVTYYPLTNVYTHIR